MATPVYNDANFRAQFPAFADTAKYPMATLSGYWTMASSYINIYSQIGWNQTQLQLAVDLLAAHLAKSFDLINAGITTMLITGSTEGTVTVSGQPPPTTNGWQWWLATTPYGMQLRALLDIVASVGLYVGGSYPRAGFRNGFGSFPT